jgi:hypothetical protein
MAVELFTTIPALSEGEISRFGKTTSVVPKVGK